MIIDKAPGARCSLFADPISDHSRNGTTMILISRRSPRYFSYHITLLIKKRSDRFKFVKSDLIRFIAKILIRPYFWTAGSISPPLGRLANSP